MRVSYTCNDWRGWILDRDAPAHTRVFVTGNRAIEIVRSRFVERHLCRRSLAWFDGELRMCSIHGPVVGDFPPLPRVSSTRWPASARNVGWSNANSVAVS